MAKAPYMLSVIQHGLESSAGMLIAATYKHFGNGTLKFDEFLNTAGFEFAAGISGGIVEPDFIADTGATLTLTDTPFSAEGMYWLGNMGIKTALTSASADTVTAFTFPTTAANSISNFTWELGTAAQEWEFGYGTVTKFNIHSDVTSSNGKIFYNVMVSGRAAVASTVTPALTFLPNLQPLNINYATVHFDALGTAGGTASASAAILRAFSIDVETGWELRHYADGRSAKDPSVAVYKNYKITGTVKLDLDTATLTRISNARAGTSEVMTIKMNGTGGRLVTVVLPLTWTEAPTINENDGDLVSVTLNFQAGYSSTSAAQGPSITVVASAAISVT